MKALRLSLALAIIAGMAASLLYVIDITSLNKSPPDYISEKDLLALNELQKGFQKCVRVNGLGLLAEPKDHCRVSMKFPIDTVPKWSDPKTGQIEGLSYDFNLCESLSLWELVRNSSTILTREYIDALPNGWRDYAWTRINKGIALNKCENRTLCKEKLSLVLPQTPPFAPRQFGHCAIVGNSGDLLKTRFGEEIDRYDAVVRNNGAPVQNYTRYVGKKSTFRLLNRGSAKALDKVAALDETGEEALIIKTTIHDIMNKMIREVPILNPVYLMLGMSLGPSAKGTGLKALEFALSICETVDIYGFTVDPGYTEWTRYFSESRGGHTPLQGRAYYQMMECLGLIKIHSPMREERGHIVQDVPDRLVIDAARMASDRVLGKVTFGNGDPLGACVMWAERAKEEKRQQLKTGVKQEPPVSQYPLQHSDSNGMLCIKPRIFRDKS